jgi:hypothetical protein
MPRRQQGADERRPEEDLASVQDLELAERESRQRVELGDQPDEWISPPSVRRVMLDAAGNTAAARPVAERAVAIASAKLGGVDSSCHLGQSSRRTAT